jgi:hypothetical protein
VLFYERGSPQGADCGEATSQPATAMNAPKVFISYSHDSPEHEDRVLIFANRLRGDGIDALIDQYNTAPPLGWPHWMDGANPGS